ncbi:hypothetical protein ERY430_80204 [Erythrobacter sp. EC-HK427]|nr:hypothetical protein ERY430_80204 [Erythrobacter sp. EC-HK427]
MCRSDRPKLCSECALDPYGAQDFSIVYECVRLFVSHVLHYQSLVNTGDFASGEGQ